MREEDKNYEIIDPESIKRRLERQRNSIKNHGVAGFAPISKHNETKALATIKSHGIEYYRKTIVYCPGCSIQAPASRMDPYELSYLINNGALAAYEELVGGLPVPDDAVFFHCKRCNYKMLAEIDEVRKMDAVTPEEYVIESVNDPNRKNKKPILTGQTKRFNRYQDRKKKEVEKRIQQAKEALDRQQEQQGKGTNNEVPANG